MTHICVSKLTTIGSDNGLSPGWRQAIIWINAGILLIGPLGTNFCEILIKIYSFSFKKMHLKMSSAKWRPSCLGLNVLMEWHPFPCTWSFPYKCNFQVCKQNPTGLYMEFGVASPLLQHSMCCLYCKYPAQYTQYRMSKNIRSPYCTL